MGKGKLCDDTASHGEKNGTAAMTHVDHAAMGHDHGKTTAEAPATSARNSAATVPGSGAVAMVAAVLAIAALL
jgi:hypothetical protein